MRSDSRAEIRVDHLLLAAVVGVICFALTDYVIARVDETQFAGLRTKTDALYVTESHAGHRGIR